MKKLLCLLSLINGYAATQAMGVQPYVAPPCPVPTAITSALAFDAWRNSSAGGYESYQRNPLATCVTFTFLGHPLLDELCNIERTKCKKARHTGVKKKSNEAQESTVYVPEKIQKLESMVAEHGLEKEVLEFVSNNVNSMLLTNAAHKTGLEILLEGDYEESVEHIYSELAQKTKKAQQEFAANKCPQDAQCPDEIAKCRKDITLQIFRLITDIEPTIGCSDVKNERWCANRGEILKLIPYGNLNVGDQDLNRDTNSQFSQVGFGDTILFHAIQREDFPVTVLALANNPCLLDRKSHYSQQLPCEMTQNPSMLKLFEIVRKASKKKLCAQQKQCE